MSKGPDTKDEGTARRRRRKASLRVPSDTVPRRPVEEPAADDSRLAVSVAYALDDDASDAATDGKSIHDLPTLLNQPVLPESPERPDTEETPVPEVVTERLPSISESESEGDAAEVPGAADDGADSADAVAEVEEIEEFDDDDDDEVTRAAHEGVASADELEAVDGDPDEPAPGGEPGPARAESAAEASAAAPDEAAPEDEVIPEIESAQVEAIDEVEPAAGELAAEHAEDGVQGPPEAEDTAVVPASVAEPGSGGDSVDIAIDEEDHDAAEAVPEEVIDLASARARQERSEPSPAPESAPAAAVEPAPAADEAPAPAAEPSRPRFVRAKTMALSEADLEEVVEEARAEAAAAAASSPEALDPGESGEILADDMLEEISDGEDAATAVDPQVVDAGPDAARPEPPDKPPPAPKPARPSPPPAPARAAAVAAVGQAQPRSPQRQGKPWFEEVFDEDYLRTLPFLTPRATQNEANFVMESFGIEPGSQVLDVACGYGRHAMELAARGYHVVGLDNSLPLLLRGADEAQRRGLTINFVHGDMREMTFDSQFDGAYCLFSSFGFFDDETNKKVAQNVARALKPGARFVVEVLNRDYLVADLPSRVWWEGDGCVVLEEVEFNYFSSRIISNRSVVFDDGRQLEQEISLRAFSLHELGKLLHAAGFRVVEISGSMATRGRFLGAHSRDIVVVAERRGGKKDSSE